MVVLATPHNTEVKCTTTPTTSSNSNVSLKRRTRRGGVIRHAHQEMQSRASEDLFNIKYEHAHHHTKGFYGYFYINRIYVS